MSTVQSFFIAWSEKVCVYLSVFKLYSRKHRNEPDSPVIGTNCSATRSCLLRLVIG